jgi:hypothetical protein
LDLKKQSGEEEETLILFARTTEARSSDGIPFRTSGMELLLRSSPPFEGGTRRVRFGRGGALRRTTCGGGAHRTTVRHRHPTYYLLSNLLGLRFVRKIGVDLEVKRGESRPPMRAPSKSRCRTVHILIPLNRALKAEGPNATCSGYHGIEIIFKECLVCSSDRGIAIGVKKLISRRRLLPGETRQTKLRKGDRSNQSYNHS